MEERGTELLIRNTNATYDTYVDVESPNESSPLLEQSYDAVIHVVVPQTARKYYEQWGEETLEILSSFKGFIRRVIYPVSSEAAFTEYVVIMVFDTLENFTAFYNSPERIVKYKELESQGIQSAVMNNYGNSTDLSKGSSSKAQHCTNRIDLQNSDIRIPRPRPPPKWKLALILMICVYVIFFLSE